MDAAAKKKPSLSLLIGIGKPPMRDREGDGDERGDEEGDPHADAASAILDAIKSDDAGALSEAMQAFYDLCRASEDEGHDERDEGEAY